MKIHASLGDLVELSIHTDARKRGFLLRVKHSQLQLEQKKPAKPLVSETDAAAKKQPAAGEWSDTQYTVTEK